MNVYKISLIAVLSAIAIVGRSLFAFIPNVQPVTAIIILTGLFLGPLSGIIIAIVITYLSNMILGMGIWTIWQIISWALIGLLAGLIGKTRFIQMPIIVLFGFISGYLYGFIISLTTYQISGKFWPYYIAGLPFDTYHAIGNVIFIAAIFPIMAHLMKTYKNNYLT